MDLSAMDLEMTGPAHVAGADPLLGSALAIGDFNDDGRQDYAAGAYGADPGATDAGLVLIALDLDPVFTPIVTASEPLNPRVSSAWPNPSRGIVSLNINSNGTAPTRLDVYDVSGRRVWSSVHSTTSGVGRIEWAGRDLAGRSASPGTYFLRVQLEGEVFERKVTLLR